MTPAACAELLKQHFPALFGGPPKPLKLRIQADINLRAPGVFGKPALSAFFRRYTGSTGYLMALGRATQRFDLDGQPAGELSEEHRNLAREELARRRQVTREREQQARAAQSAQPHPQRLDTDPDQTPATAPGPVMQPAGQPTSQPTEQRQPPHERPPQRPSQRPPQRAQERPQQRPQNRPQQRPQERPPQRQQQQPHQASAPQPRPLARSPEHPTMPLPAQAPDRQDQAPPAQQRRPAPPPQPRPQAQPPLPALHPAELAEQAAQSKARQDRLALLRDFERTTLTLANFCVLKRLTPDALKPQLELARKEAAEAPPQRPMDDRRGGSQGGSPGGSQGSWPGGAPSGGPGRTAAPADSRGAAPRFGPSGRAPGRPNSR